MDRGEGGSGLDFSVGVMEVAFERLFGLFVMGFGIEIGIRIADREGANDL